MVCSYNIVPISVVTLSIGHVVTLEHYGDPHLAAVLIKKYMKELPEPLFPEKVYSRIQRCPPISTDVTDMSSIMYIRDTLFPELPHCSYVLLSHIFRQSWYIYNSSLSTDS